MDGENTGKKKSPEEVHMILRRDLNANELVSAQQIRSLFSKWSKQLKDGTLSELADEELEIETNEEDTSVQYQDELHELATELSVVWSKDDWLVVLYEDQWYPGVVLEVSLVIII